MCHRGWFSLLVIISYYFVISPETTVSVVHLYLVSTLISVSIDLHIVHKVIECRHFWTLANVETPVEMYLGA